MNFVCTYQGKTWEIGDIFADAESTSALLYKAEAEGEKELALRLYDELVDKLNSMMFLYASCKGREKRKICDFLKRAFGVKKIAELDYVIKHGIPRKAAL